MKKIALVAALLTFSGGSAFATCTGPAVMHDFPGTSFNMSLATNSGDGNCASNVVVIGPSIPNFTSAQAVTGTFWQTTQPVSLTSTTITGTVAITQSTSPWVVSNGGTFATQSAITAASASIASGAYASGSIGSGAMVDLGAIADAAATAGGTGTLSAKMRLMTTQLGTINTTLGTPMQATGGTVGLVAGSAIAGKFGIDQTTPGTTNGVQVNSSALPTGAATSANQTSQITQETATATGVGTPTDAVASAPASATSATMIALLKALVNTGQYPAGATAITASATGTTAATTATLAGTTGKTTYICGLSIRANATAAATGNATVTGTITGTLNFTQWIAPLASGLGVTEQIFNPCVPASTTNTGIAIVSAAPGSGGVVSSTGWGYQL